MATTNHARPQALIRQSAYSPTPGRWRLVLGALVLLALLFASTSAHAQGRLDRAARKRLHREALVSIGLELGIFGATQLPLVVTHRDPRLPAYDSEDFDVMFATYHAFVVAFELAGTSGGAALLASRANVLGARDGAPRVPRVYGRSMAGQWAVVLPTQLVSVAVSNHFRVQGPESQAEVRRLYVYGTVLPELFQVVVGSYLAAFLVEKRRAAQPPELLPFASPAPGGRGFVIGVQGRLGARVANGS
ncbi:MAG: hypothetical protein U0230_14210 [Polyangiales bacterium]